MAMGIPHGGLRKIVAAKSRVPELKVVYVNRNRTTDI